MWYLTERRFWVCVFSIWDRAVTTLIHKLLYLSPHVRLQLPYLPRGASSTYSTPCGMDEPPLVPRHDGGWRGRLLNDTVARCYTITYALAYRYQYIWAGVKPSYSGLRRVACAPSTLRLPPPAGATSRRCALFAAPACASCRAVQHLYRSFFRHAEQTPSATEGDARRGVS